jgi:hypothetical protein
MLKLYYYFCLLLLILGQFTLLFKIGESNVYAFDVAIIIFSIFGICYFLLVKKSIVISRSHFYFIFFCFVALASLIFSFLKYTPDEIMSGSMYLVRFVAYLSSGVVVYNMRKNGLIAAKEIFYSIVVSGILLGAGGIVQLFLLPDFGVLDPGLGWDPHKNRLASTFFDPNFVGCYLSICLVLLLDKWYSEKKFLITDFLFFSFTLVSVFLTFSRSAWVMLAVIIFIFGWFRSRTLLYVSLMVAFCAYFAVPRVQTRISGTTDPADSARYRFGSWSTALQVSKENLLLGVGFNNYKIAQKDLGLLSLEKLDYRSATGSDSSLLLVLATTGITGLLIYLAGLVTPIFSEKKLDVMMLALTAGLLADSLFINSLFYPQIMFLLFSIHSFSRT